MMEVLNSTHVAEGGVGPEIAGRLLDRARSAKAARMADTGGRHDSGTDQALAELARDAGALAALDPLMCLPDRDTALAFWINVYNTLVIHGALHFRVRRAITDFRGFFRRVSYNIGGHLCTPDDIEHGLLRENRGHPARVWVPQLMPWDPRRSWVIRPMDRRIHFALNCGATSCPPIRHYAAGSLEAELSLATRAFLSGGGAVIDPDGRGLLLSRIFLWYPRDFGWTRRRQVKSILPYLEASNRAGILSAAARGIRYADYDWHFA